ncbi:MAG TPA: MFS transporter [Rectinemataceae bacterium]
MPAPLSPAKLATARKDFYVFNFLNSFSFIFVSGSFLTLYALRLGASNAIVGVLNAIAYANFFLMPLGKHIVRSRPIVWTFGWGWVARYAALVPSIFAPLFASRGQTGIALGLLVASIAGFAIFRGLALIGNNPVVDYLASGGGDKPRSDRGQFMTNNSIINSIAGMSSGFILAFFLGEKATPWTYAIGVGIGVLIGWAGSYYLLRTPEPEGYMPSGSRSLVEITREALKDRHFKRFILIFMAFAFISGMGRSFLPVYAKESFSQGDDAVMVYSLISSLGAIAMGFLMRLVVDRLGSKPLLIIFGGIGLIGFLPVAVFPGPSIFGSAASAAIFLSTLHFLSAFGFSGQENACQTYYFTLVPKEKTMDLSVVYFIAYGFGGAVGSGFGGILLDILSSAGLSVQSAYRALYGVLCALGGIAIASMRKLKPLGSASVSRSLGVMLSVRDLRAFDLLTRLDRSADASQEVKLIQEIGRSASPLTQEELLDYLRSPRFQVRMEALLALEELPELSPKVLRYLIRETETHTFTTSYLAARILGKHGTSEAIPALRKALEAEDYMLQGTAAIALAKLGDTESLPLLESILVRSPNPRVKISIAYALETLGSVSSLPTLVASLKRSDPPAFVSDEIVLAMASIMGVLKEFYPLYSAFLQDQAQGLALLSASAQDIIADSQTFQDWKQALEALFAHQAEPKRGSAMAAFLLRTGRNTQVEVVLSEALIDASLCYSGVEFLAAAYPILGRQAEDTGPGRISALGK